MNEIQTLNEKRVTLQEIANITGAAYSTVAAYAQRAGWTKNGVQTLLDETQVTIIIEAMKQATTNQSNLPSRLEGVETSQSRALQLKMLNEQMQAIYEAELAELRAEKEHLQIEAAENKPKLEHYEQCMAAKDAISMRYAAAVLNIPGMGRNNLFAKLRKKQVLDGNNIPYRKYQDAGYFRIIENSYTDTLGDKHITLTTLVFPQGLDFIRRSVDGVERN